MENFNLHTKKPLIVAEVGNNHEGNFALAEKMVILAKEAGADAVKFQTFIPELYIPRTDQARFDRLKSFQLSFKQFEDLAKLSQSLGLLFFSTPLDLESAQFLNEIQPVFKIASGDNDFIPLLDLVASFKKPTIVSTGMLNSDEIQAISQRFTHHWQKDLAADQLAFLHCVTSYPVVENEANLAAVTTMKNHYPNHTIGYSDHTLGINACVYAAVLGARIIEKHFTIDNHYSSFRDHQLSANPASFKQMVIKINQAIELLGSGSKLPQACEQPFMYSIRRRAVTKRSLSAGYKIGLEDIVWLRNDQGLAPDMADFITNNVLLNDVKKDDFLFHEHFITEGKD